MSLPKKLDNLEDIRSIIKEYEEQLKNDKCRFQKTVETLKKQSLDVDHKLPLNNYSLYKDDTLSSRNTVSATSQTKEKSVLRGTPEVYMFWDSREKEKEKLINAISKPKSRHSYPSVKQPSRFGSQARSDLAKFTSPIDDREKQKDQLAEHFASSGSPYIKPSCHQLCKNLQSSIFFNDCRPNDLKNTNSENEKLKYKKEETFERDKKSNNNIDEKYLRTKYDLPEIIISDFQENNIIKKVGIDCKDNKMVRIGEYSPLNPNLPGGNTVLGLGDWEEKRKLYLEQQRQVSRSPSPTRDDDNRQLRSVATQTDLEDDWSSSYTMEKSPKSSCHGGEKLSTSTSPQCQYRTSPIPKCFEGMSEKEIKEFLYREDLRKQIEEKNRLKEEMKRKEAEEDAKIEAKIQRDMEKLRKQEEEERKQRLEQAIKKKEEYDRFKEMLEHIKADESKTKKKQPLNESADPSYSRRKQSVKSTQYDIKKKSTHSKSVKIPLSQALHEEQAASALSSVHQELRQPLLKLEDSATFSEGLKTSKEELPLTKSIASSPTSDKIPNIYKSTSPPIHRGKEVDILAQKAVFDPHIPRTSQQANSVSSVPSDTVRDRLKEVDSLLKQPLLPDSRILPPVSQPLLHATIPPLSPSLQASRRATVPPSNRTNADILEDKWQVPYTQDDEAPPSTKHEPRILTQLGTFRKHLQEESLRMRQRVREDSP